MRQPLGTYLRHLRHVRRYGRGIRALARAPSIRYQSDVGAVHDLVLRSLGFGNDDSRTNGELTLLRTLLPAGSPVVFDVGANRGGYTQLVLEIARDARVHSFEPSSTAYAELERRFTHEAGVEVHNVALGESEGNAVLFAPSPGSELGSLYRRTHAGAEMHEAETVLVRRLDSLCAELAIPRIDLLKIDAEGHEIAVLRGAGSMLDGRRIGAIQFEHGGTAPDARVFLRDFFDLLIPAYVVHRILPDGLWPLREYRERDETALYANYVGLPA